MYTLPCDYHDQRHVWLDSAPCPPPLSYQFPRGVFTSFMMEHLNQSDTTRIINRCSQSWSYMDTTTEAVTTMEMAMSTEKVTVSTDSTSTEEPKTEAPSCEFVFFFFFFFVVVSCRDFVVILIVVVVVVFCRDFVLILIVTSLKKPIERGLHFFT